MIDSGGQRALRASLGRLRGCRGIAMSGVWRSDVRLWLLLDRAASLCVGLRSVVRLVFQLPD